MMKKIIALLALAAVVAGPAQALAITTSLTNGSSSSSGGPVVVAKWEMDGPYATSNGTDAATTAGAQMAPNASYGTPKIMSICGIVIDANGRDYVSKMYGDVYYPTTVVLGSTHRDPVTGQLREVKTCGEMVRECQMTKLSQADAMSLFCTKIRNTNNNLPTFATNYSFANICDDANAGVLEKQTAYLECCDFTLSYEDPAGTYTVSVWGTDVAGTNGSPLSNSMAYLQSKAFDLDFLSINYGNVVPGIWKAVAGDTTWTGTPGANSATIRNVSSTPLQIGVWQDDMGIKDPDGSTFVTFGAAIGSGSAYTTYGPNLTVSSTDPTHKATNIVKYLKLSEQNEMDFEVNVSKFPQGLDYTNPLTGTVELSATNIAQIPCNATTLGGTYPANY